MIWKTSSRCSQDARVQAGTGLTWRKARASSQNGGCVEVALADDDFAETAEDDRK